MHTRSMALVFSPDTAGGRSFAALPPGGGAPVLARLGTLIKNVAPVFLLCDPRDIGVAERLKDTHFGEATLYVFDSYPGGSGLSEALVNRLTEVLAAATDLVRGCPCREGCPSCIGPRDARQQVGDNPKELLLGFLSEWLDRANHDG